MNFENLTWSCDICKSIRPDERISVWKVDITPKDANLPAFTVTRHVKYCNDNVECEQGAKNWKERVSA